MPPRCNVSLTRSNCHRPFTRRYGGPQGPPIASHNVMEKASHFTRRRALPHYLNAGIPVRFVVTKRGSLLTAKLIVPPPPFAKPVPRGDIKEFSRASRLRMLKWVAAIDWQRATPASFVTLTYPDSRASVSMEQRTMNRHLFIRDIESHLGNDTYGIWRIEWKSRKSGKLIGKQVPHFHLLLMNVPYIPYQKIRLWWKRALQHDGLLATDIRQCKNAKQAALYVAKYMTKVPASSSLDNHAYLSKRGRHWGLMRQRSIPLCPLEAGVKIEPLQFEAAYDEACRVMPWLTPGQPDSFTALGKKADQLYEIFRKYGVAFERVRG